MTNRLHSLLRDHLLAPLDAVYLRIDEDRLDGAAAPAPPVATAPAARDAAPSRLRHLTH